MKTEGNYLEYRGAPYASARRYEPGTLPIDHVRGLSAALDLLEEMGRDAVLSRTLELVRALAEGLAARGWKIVTPEPFASGILAAVPPGGDAASWAKRLEGRGVITSPREGAVRFSPHAGNDLGEVERALEAIDTLGPT
jgi:selenocysteine lyase/cysteine desulfurase